MSIVKSFPSWPIAIVDALAAKRDESPHGCGSCIHAAWMSPVDGSPGPKAPVEFSLGGCRAAVQLERGRSGLRATTFCTSWNVPLGGVRLGTSEMGANQPDKLQNRPTNGAHSRELAGSPSLNGLFQ
jgi:hypothetical protein